MSHFEILDTISFFPLLLQGSPLRGSCYPAEARGQSPSWDMAPQRGSACSSPLLSLARHDALLLGYSKLGSETCAWCLMQSTDRGGTWGMAMLQTSSSQPHPYPAASSSL